MRLAVTIGALALGASGLTVTVLPRPAFPGPSTWTPYAPPHRLVLVSSQSVPVTTTSTITSNFGSFRGLPLQTIIDTANRRFRMYGVDGSTVRYLVAESRGRKALYAFDFKNYAWPPRIKPGEREFVYEQPVWAQEAGGTLYVETAHSTYASSSYNRNGYVTAIDLTTKRALWRSPALVANANTFLVTKRYLVTGYGFTNEPDYLYLLDRATGKVVDRLALPNAPEKITWQQGLIRVRTYDHVVTVRLKGA
jgi:hypothetical protein